MDHISAEAHGEHLQDDQSFQFNLHASARMRKGKNSSPRGDNVNQRLGVLESSVEKVTRQRTLGQVSICFAAR